MKRTNAYLPVLLAGLAMAQADPMRPEIPEEIPTDPQSVVFHAVQSGDSQTLLELCESGADINAVDRMGNFPLRAAVLYQLNPQLEELTGQLNEAFGQDSNVMEAFGSEKLSYADISLLGQITQHSVGNMHDATPHEDCIEPSRQMMEILLKAGAKPNLKDPSGMTALHYAAGLGDLILTRMLMEHGADVNAVSIIGISPLSAAVKRESAQLVRELLDAGAYPDTADADGWSPLHWAAQTGNEEIARMLLEHGTRLEARDSAGYTPLNTAAEKGGLEVVKLLLEAGADPKSISGGVQYTPLMSASLMGHTEIVRTLIAAGVDIDWTSPASGYTSLMQAAQYARLAMVELLLESGAEVNAVDAAGNSVLHLAIQHPVHATAMLEELLGKSQSAGWGPDSDRVEVVRILLEAGADPHARNKHDNTPMHYLSINWDSTEVAKLLADYGAEIDPRGNSGMTPLYNAAGNGFTGLVRFFLENGAAVSVQDTNLGATPLHWAISNDHQFIAELLLAHGADVNIMDRARETPVMKILYTGNLAIFEALYEVDATILNQTNQSGHNLLHLSAAMGYPNVVGFLLGKGMDPNALDRLGQSPLWLACSGFTSKDAFEMRKKAASMTGMQPLDYRESAKTMFSFGDEFAEVAKRLVEAGAEVNFILSSSGQTLLNVACNSGNLDVVKVLLENGADATLPAPSSGCLPIHTAADYGQSEVVEFFLQRGVDANIKTRDAFSPLHYAAYSIFSLPRNYLELVDLLVEHGANVDSYSNTQWKTSLYSAIAQKNFYVAERLIHHGASFSSPDRITGERYYDYAKSQFNKPLVAVMSARRHMTPVQGFHDSIGNEENIVARIGSDQIRTRDLIAYAGGPDSFFKDYRLSDLEDPEQIGNIMEAVHKRLLDTAVEFVSMVLMNYASELAGLKTGDLAVQEKYKQLVLQLGVSAYNLPNDLRPYDWTPEDFEKVAQWQARSAQFESEIIGAGTNISPAALADYYESVKGRFLSPVRVHLQIIVLTNPTAVEEVLSHLKTGSDFGKIAKQYSSHSSGEFGGDLGWSVLEDLNKDFLNSFTEIKTGALGKPVDLGGQTYIVRIAELAEPAPAPLDEVAGELQAELLEAARKPIEHRILRILSRFIDTEFYIPVPWEI